MLAWIVWLSAVVFFLYVLCIWKRLEVSVQVLRAAAKVINYNYFIVLVPLFAIAFCALIIYLAFYFLLYLLTCGKLVSSTFDNLNYKVYVFTDL